MPPPQWHRYIPSLSGLIGPSLQVRLSRAAPEHIYHTCVRDAPLQHRELLRTVCNSHPAPSSPKYTSKPTCGCVYQLHLFTRAAIRFLAARAHRNRFSSCMASTRDMQLKVAVQLFCQLLSTLYSLEKRNFRCYIYQSGWTLFHIAVKCKIILRT